MNKTRKFLTAVSRKLQLPAEAVAGAPKIELTGQQMFAMEPYEGLLEYGENQILIGSQYGKVRLWGKQLAIIGMNHRRITIEGTIAGTEWVNIQDE